MIWIVNISYKSHKGKQARSDSNIPCLISHKSKQARFKCNIPRFLAVYQNKSASNVTPNDHVQGLVCMEITRCETGKDEGL